MDLVRIGEKDYPYKLSYRALKKISSLSSKGEIGIESAEHALFWALYSGWSIENNPSDFPFKIEEMEGLFDDDLKLFVKVQKDMQALTEEINGEGEGKQIALSANTGTGPNN